MTQNEKDLLLKDLCARMPYNTKVQLTEYSNLTGEKLPSEIRILDYYMIGKVQAYCKGFRKDEVKPYLFPISSITKEQKNEYDNLRRVVPTYQYDYKYGDFVGGYELCDTVESIDYLYKNHIDVRGLIPMGLAIDATNKKIY